MVSSRRLDRHVIFVHGDEFRKRADPVLIRSRIDLVTGLEAPHPCSHLDHNAGDVVAENKWETIRQEDFEFSVRDLCIEEIDAGSVDLDEYVVVPDLRLRHVDDPAAVLALVTIDREGFHWPLLFFVVCHARERS